MQLSTPADLLALIPTLINREPEEMLVIVTLKDHQMQAVQGIEHVQDTSDLGDYVASIIGQVLSMRADALVMVFYSEGDSQLLRSAHMLLHLGFDMVSRMEVHPSLLVKGGRYQIIGSQHWHDIEEVKDSALAASLVLNGFPLTPQGLVIPEPAAVTEAVTAAIDDRLASIPKYPDHIEDAWRMPYVTEERALYEDLLNRGFGATEPEAVRMIACFQNPLLRDRLMVDTITSTVDPAEFGGAITGNSESVPDQDRVLAASSLLDNLMQWTCDRHRMPLLMAQAWMSWMQGRALDAVQYLDVAQAADPDFTIAKAFRRYIEEIKRVPNGLTHGDD